MADQVPLETVQSESAYPEARSPSLPNRQLQYTNAHSQQSQCRAAWKKNSMSQKVLLNDTVPFSGVNDRSAVYPDDFEVPSSCTSA